MNTPPRFVSFASFVAQHPHFVSFASFVVKKAHFVSFASFVVRKPRFVSFVVSLSFVVLLCGCEREPALFLCDHVTSAPARVAVDWSHFTRFETPTGMTVKLFERDDSGTYRLRQTTSTNDLTHVDYYLPAGHYAFNQSEDEFGTVTFDNTDDWQTAAVNTVRGKSEWYKDSITDSPLVSNIEWVGIDRHEGLELAQERMDAAGGQRITIDTLHPRNIVRTVTVYVHIKNIVSLRSAASPAPTSSGRGTQEPAR